MRGRSPCGCRCQAGLSARDVPGLLRCVNSHSEPPFWARVAGWTGQRVKLWLVMPASSGPSPGCSVYFTNITNDQGWTRPRPGARTLRRLRKKVGGDPCCCPLGGGAKVPWGGLQVSQAAPSVHSQHPPLSSGLLGKVLSTGVVGGRCRGHNSTLHLGPCSNPGCAVSNPLAPWKRAGCHARLLPVRAIWRANQ